MAGCCFGMPSASLFADALPNQGRSLFLYSQTQGLPSQLRYFQDIVVLTDGTLLRGEIEQLPMLKYDFGKVPLDLNAISLFSSLGSGKWRVAASSGNEYVAALADLTLVFIEHLTDEDGAVIKKSKKIPLENVEFLLLKSRENTSYRADFRLTFNNGDVLPVYLIDQQISLSDGWKKKVIQAREIIDVSFNGGLFGTVKKASGQEEELSLAFVSHPTIGVTVDPGMGVMHMPWKNIANICKSSLDFDRNRLHRSQQIAISGKQALLQNVQREMPDPLLSNSRLTEIPEIAFLDEPVALLGDTGDFGIPDILFSFEPKPLLAATETFKIPEIVFPNEPQPLLAAEEILRIPEIDFKGDPEPLLAFSEIYIPEISFPEAEILIDHPSLDLAEMIAFADDIEFEDGEKEGAAGTSESSQQNALDDEDIIFISEGSGERLPFLAAVAAEEEAIVFNEETDRLTSQLIPKQQNQQQIPSQPVKQGAEQKQTPPKELPSPHKTTPKPFSEKRDTKSKEKPNKESYIAPAPQTVQETKSQSNPYEGMQYVASLPDGGFYIQRRKVTNKEYQQFVKAVNYKTPLHWIGGHIPPGQEEEPVVNISYKDSLLFAVWSGKRLPTEKELITAFEASGVITDTADRVDEWTSTPYFPGRESPGSEDKGRAKFGGDPTSGHVIFGKSYPNPMRNNDYNSSTGFRLAASAR